MRLLNPRVRTGQGSTRLSREEFQRRWKERFYDPAFAAEKESIDRLAEIAWQAYEDRRKSPRTRKAGLNLQILSMSLRWNGSRRVSKFSPPKSNTRIQSRLPASCSSAVPRARTKPVQAKCRRAFELRKRQRR